MEQNRNEQNGQVSRLKTAVIVLAIFLVVNLGLSGYLLSAQMNAGGTATATEQAATSGANDAATSGAADATTGEEQTKYVLYIGTNDKDTYKQEIPYDECVAKVTEICTRYTGGCTLAEATGYWKDDSGEITTEQSIQCTLEDITLEQVHQIADAVRTALNQNSILIETQGVTSEFYAG